MTASTRQHTCLETQQMADERSSARLVLVLGAGQCQPCTQCVVRGIGRAGGAPLPSLHGQAWSEHSPLAPEDFMCKQRNRKVHLCRALLAKCCPSCSQRWHLGLWHRC